MCRPLAQQAAQDELRDQLLEMARAWDGLTANWERLFGLRRRDPEA